MATETYRHRRNRPFDPDGTSFVRTGFEIIGWNGYDHRHNETPDYPLTQQIPGFARDTDLYACWQKQTYTVSLAAGTGGTVTGSGTYEYGDVANVKATPDAGYAFRKWSDDDANAERSLTVTSDISLTASFDPRTYAVTLDPRGGTINSGNITEYTYGVGAVLPTDVTRTDYDFNGWYTAASGGTRTTAISTTATGDKTYYAHWTSRKSWVRIGLLRGGAHEDPTVAYHDIQELIVKAGWKNDGVTYKYEIAGPFQPTGGAWFYEAYYYHWE